MTLECGGGGPGTPVHQVFQGLSPGTTLALQVLGSKPQLKEGNPEEDLTADQTNAQAAALYKVSWELGLGLQETGEGGKWDWARCSEEAEKWSYEDPKLVNVTSLPASFWGFELGPSFRVLGSLPVSSACPGFL